MLFLIGLGIGEKGISLAGLDALEKCQRVFLENYTVEFPYSKESLQNVLGMEIEEADREIVEGLDFIEEAREKNIALLVYGDVLTATTHVAILEECRKKEIECEIIHGASVLDAVAETGLQIYKFGKITSMPKFEANSFVEIVKQNKKIGAHSLILVDIGLEFEKALERLHDLIQDGKLIVCSRLGMKEQKIFYSDFENLKSKKVAAPFCFVVPGKLHFAEEEVLENFK